MSVDVGRMLQSLAGSLMSGSLFELRSGYEQGTAAGTGFLIAQLAQQLEVAADWLVEENAALRALFRDAAPVVTDAPLRGRLADVAAGADPSLRLADLRAGNDALRALLIELHAWTEAQEGDAARRLETAVWQELARSTRRREPPAG